MFGSQKEETPTSESSAYSPHDDNFRANRSRQVGGESGTEKGSQQQGCGSQVGATGLLDSLLMPTDPFCSNVFTCIRQSAWDYSANRVY